MGATLGQVPRDLRKADEFAVWVAQRCNDHVRPEPGTVLPQAPAFVFEAARLYRLGEFAFGQLPRERFRRVEDREVPSDDLVGMKSLEALGTGVPCLNVAIDVEQEDGVVPDGLDQKAETLLPLREMRGMDRVGRRHQNTLAQERYRPNGRATWCPHPVRTARAESEF